MASVEELLMAARANRSPFQSLAEGLLQGVGQAQSGALERAKTLMAMDQARQEMEQQAEMQKQIKAQFASQQEAGITQAHAAVGTQNQPLPQQKLKMVIQQDEKGRYSRKFETVEEPAAGVKQAATPAGFRWTTTGDLEAIPGGPADIKGQKEEEKSSSLRRAAVSQADRIIATVDQASAKVGPLTTGLGAKTRDIPGSPAKDLASDLRTIKANLGFAELQAMRQASPTGGALGQIAVQELEALQATLASLDQEQSPTQLKANLEKVKKHYENWKKTMDDGSQANSLDAQANPATSSGDIALTGEKASRLAALRKKAAEGSLK